VWLGETFHYLREVALLNTNRFTVDAGMSVNRPRLDRSMMACFNYAGVRIVGIGATVLLNTCWGLGRKLATHTGRFAWTAV